MKKNKSLVAEIAKILSEGRISAGFTQKELGKKMGISQSAMSKMESAKLEPSAIQWMKFARYTNTKADVLMKFIGGKDSAD